MKQSQVTVFQVLKNAFLTKVENNISKMQSIEKAKNVKKNTISVETPKNQFGYWMVTNRLFKTNLYLFKG